MDREVKERSMLDTYVEQVESGIRAHEIRPEIRAELEDHLYNHVEASMDQGMSRSEAEASAVQQMGSIEEMVGKFNAVHRTRIPWTFWGWLAAWLVLSVVALWTAIQITQEPYITDRLLGIQGIYLVLSLIVFSIAALIDYRWWHNKGLYMYGTALLLNLLSQFQDIEDNRQVGWILIGPIGLDTVVISTFFCLLGTFIMISHYRSKYVKISGRFQLVIVLLGIIPPLLYLEDRQYHASIIYGTGFLIVLLVQSFPLRRIMIGGSLIAMPLGWHVLEQEMHIVQRLEGWLANITGQGTEESMHYISRYQQLITESGWWGRGLTETTFIPDALNNNMSLVLVRAYGWFGGLVMLSILLGWLFWLFRSSYQVKQDFGRRMILFISYFVAIPVPLSIGGIIGFAPLNSAGLPLLGFGFSSIAVWMFALGLCTSIYMRKDIIPWRNVKGQGSISFGKEDGYES